MRIISQDRKYDLPYDSTLIINKPSYGFDDKEKTKRVYIIVGVFDNQKYILGEYDSQEKIDFLLGQMHEYYVNSNSPVVVILPSDKEVILPENDHD